MNNTISIPLAKHESQYPRVATDDTYAERVLPFVSVASFPSSRELTLATLHLHELPGESFSWCVEARTSWPSRHLPGDWAALLIEVAPAPSNTTNCGIQLRPDSRSQTVGHASFTLELDKM